MSSKTYFCNQTIDILLDLIVDTCGNSHEQSLIYEGTHRFLLPSIVESFYNQRKKKTPAQRTTPEKLIF